MIPYAINKENENQKKQNEQDNEIVNKQNKGVILFTGKCLFSGNKICEVDPKYTKVDAYISMYHRTGYNEIIVSVPIKSTANIITTGYFAPLAGDDFAEIEISFDGSNLNAGYCAIFAGSPAGTRATHLNDANYHVYKVVAYE